MGEWTGDLSDDVARAKITRRIASLRGMYRIAVTRYRPRRSDRQNRYYWPVVVKGFAQHLRDHGNEATEDQAHELLKHKFLRREMVDEHTGEVMAYTESTTRLSTVEFNEYLDQCAAWLAELGLIIPDPTPHHEREEAAA